MQDTRTDMANEPDANTRPDEMRAARPTDAATTADIAHVDDDKTIDMAEAVEEPEPAEHPPTEHVRAEAAEPAPTREPDTTPLFNDTVTGEFRDRLTDVQSAFVDQPRTAVE